MDKKPPITILALEPEKSIIEDMLREHHSLAHVSVDDPDKHINTPKRLFMVGGAVAGMYDGLLHAQKITVSEIQAKQDLLAAQLQIDNFVAPSRIRESRAERRKRERTQKKQHAKKT